MVGQWLFANTQGIWNFGPEAVAPVKEKGGHAEASRPKVDTMLNIADKPQKYNFAAVKPASAVSYFGVIEMTPQQWADIHDNPRQRDTEAHAKRAAHLRTPHPSHVKVNAARSPDGTFYKLDGHTRSYLWKTGQVPAPDKLFVDVWNCFSLQDVKDLYATFDSRAAVETSPDQMFGGIRESGLSFQSELLKSNRYAAALRYGYELLFGQNPARAISVYDLLKYWTPELKLLDECEPTRKRFHTGVAVAALITFRRYGREASDFWTTFARDGGSKIAGEKDAVQAFGERMLRRRAEGSISGRSSVQDIVAIALSAFDRHRRGETYSAESSGIKALQINSLRTWLIAAKNAKRS